MTEKSIILQKNKIVNDPVYGFIDISSDIIFEIIEHSFFQRLRRIKQLGLTYLVYPGATHTRLQHAMGAMHLMKLAIEVLRNKGQEITKEEAQAVTIAILLHDIGHGPFSHALERTIVEGVSHEEISLLFMEKLNKTFDGKLSMAIEIFKNQYHKKFLHQLVSSQLDMDRLDYLQRDSFFSGVSEGIVGVERIIKMLQVVDDELVVEEKGIYSVEKFLIARRLMYWQVYLHKTVLSAEKLLVKILQRAKELSKTDKNLFATPALAYFLYNDVNLETFKNEENSALEQFAKLDDYDIISSIKVWCEHNDIVLSSLCKGFIDRNLLKIKFQKQPFDENIILNLKKDLKSKLSLSETELEYLIFEGKIKNNAYSTSDEKINILYKDGSLVDIADASDILNISVLSKVVEKHYLCFWEGK